jgi:hypothetical protein
VGLDASVSTVDSDAHSHSIQLSAADSASAVGSDALASTVDSVVADSAAHLASAVDLVADGRGYRLTRRVLLTML